MKIKLDLTEKELQLVTEWLECQNVEDTRRIIKENKLNMNDWETENALYNLWWWLNKYVNL